LDIIPDYESLESFLDSDDSTPIVETGDVQQDNSDDEFPVIEILSPIEDPSTAEAEYQRYLDLQYQNLTSDLPAEAPSTSS
jgi:hypothetical protein